MNAIVRCLRVRLLPCVWLLVSAPAQAVGTAAQPLRLLFQERPPYTSVRADGQVSGLLGTPLQDAMHRAGVVFRWEAMPSQRQLLLVQTGQAPVCGVGWFQNAERDRLGQFSRPVYRDLPMGAVVRAEVPLTNGASLHDTLAEGRLTLLTKEGFSYGTQIDGWLATLPVRRVSTGNEPAQLVRMLAAGRADWMLVAPEEAQQMLEQFVPGSLRVVRFADVGPGLTRHLYCNFHVPTGLMRRINDALPRLAPAR